MTFAAPADEEHGSEASEAALWAAVRKEGSMEARSRLFERNIDLARRLARRHFQDRATGDIDYHDLLQSACAGLLEAIDRFDPSLGVPFTGFARKRITGSILDAIAKASEYREQLTHYRRCQTDRLGSLRTPPSGDLADSLEGFADMLVGLAIGLIIEERAASEAEINAYESLAWRETVKAVHVAIDGLPDRERLILRGHYEGLLGFEQLASLLGVSKGRVSQLHRAALTTLRKRLGRNNPFTFSG